MYNDWLEKTFEEMERFDRNHARAFEEEDEYNMWLLEEYYNKELKDRCIY